MSDLDEHAAWQRLAAADPAGPDPDLTALHARILQSATADSAASRPGAGSPGRAEADSGSGADVVALRPRRPVTQRVFGLAAGVALLAGVGLGGYVLGHRSSGADVVAGGAPAAQMLAGTDQAEKSVADAAAEDGSARVTVPSAAPAPLAADAPATAFTGPTTADELAGFGVTDAGIDRPALSAQLARALGVGGEPVMLPSGDWVVGPGEGSNAILVVGASAAVPWSMTNPAPPLPGGTALSESRANEIARTIFGRLGVPVDDVEWEAVSVGGLVTETAWYVVDGERTPMFWRLAFDQSGEIVSASGFAGTLLPLPETAVE